MKSKMFLIHVTCDACPFYQVRYSPKFWGGSECVCLYEQEAKTIKKHKEQNVYSVKIPDWCPLEDCEDA